MNPFDLTLLALCAYRENRSGGIAGMQSVINVVMNRTYRRKSSAYEEVTRPWQFSSITAKNDPQLANWPMLGDPQWILAQRLAGEALAGALQDITGGATSYYAVAMKEPPAWASEMRQTAVIAGQRFLKETV